MVTISYGADSASKDLAGMSVSDLLAKLRDGGIEGINQRLNAGETVDVLVNGSTADQEKILAEGDHVTIQKTAELGR